MTHRFFKRPIAGTPLYLYYVLLGRGNEVEPHPLASHPGGVEIPEPAGWTFRRAPEVAPVGAERHLWVMPIKAPHHAVDDEPELRRFRRTAP